MTLHIRNLKAFPEFFQEFFGDILVWVDYHPHPPQGDPANMAWGGVGSILTGLRPRRGRRRPGRCRQLGRHQCTRHLLHLVF